MKVIKFNRNKENIIKQISQRRVQYSRVLVESVRKIMEGVRDKGDSALQELTLKYDKVKLSSFRVSQREIEEASKNVSSSIRRALKDAAFLIKKFHRSTLPKEIPIKTVSGVTVWREWRAIERVGLYIPGGKASYPSTALMLGIPAKLAGCKQIITCTPPNLKGEVASEVLAALQLVGIREVYKVAGAQAIAAMAYGTESIPKVDKIFGPGNAYVTTAKLLLYPEVDIDMPAGPTEIFIIADETANPSYIAADVLSQLEHSEDAQAILITPILLLIKGIQKEIKKQMRTLPRKDITQKSLSKSQIILVSSLEDAVNIANSYAPEHLEIMTQHPSKILKKIINVGSVFLGPFSPVSAGDYSTGANHTLPTNAFARTFSPLSVESFGKKIQIQKLTKEGLLRINPIVSTIAQAEGLTAHKKAVDIRFEAH